MAKINARGTRQIGPTLYTERFRPAVAEWDTDRIYYEAWRLRSDGWIQTRIIRTWDVADKSKATEHRGSAFTNWRRFKNHDAGMAEHARLREMLAKMKADVVKESY